MRYLITAVLLLFATAAASQQVQSTGDYQIHYNAFPSSFLAPEIARDYGVLRSRTRGVLLVSVKRADQPATATVAAEVGPGGGRLEELPLRAVRTNGTTSYLASFAIADGESRQFRIHVAPPDAEPLEIEFNQQFFDQP